MPMCRGGLLGWLPEEVAVDNLAASFGLLDPLAVLGDTSDPLAEAVAADQVVAELASDLRADVDAQFLDLAQPVNVVAPRPSIPASAEGP